MKSGQIFEHRTAVGLAWLGGGAFAVSLFFMVFADPVPDEKSWRADAFSRSAIGYHALTRFLDSEVPVLVSRSFSAAKASAERPLLLLEPPPEPEAFREMVVTALGRGAPVVVVLPKWRAEPMAGYPRWVDSLELVPPAVPEERLATALGKEKVSFEILRPAPSEGVEDAGTMKWASPLFSQGQPPRLSLAEPRQLLRDRGALFEPLVANGDRLLVAKASGAELYVVTDPDLLNSRGLARGENAVLVHRFLIDHLAPSAIVVDESLHGYRQASSVWRALLEYPLITLSLHLAGLAALVLWAGSGRFGRPLEAPPRVPPGKHTLVDNTARLFGFREHLRESLERYFRLVVARAAADLGARLGGGGGGFHKQVAALSRLGRHRGTRSDLEELGRLCLSPPTPPEGAVVRLPHGRPDPRRVLETARDLNRWRKEIVNGKRGRPSSR